MAEFLLDAPDVPPTDLPFTDRRPTDHGPTDGSPGERGAAGYRLRLAGNSADVLAVQRLRRRCDPVSVQLASGPAAVRVDVDDITDHLIVTAPGSAREVVGTVRILPPHSNDAFPRGSGLLAHLSFGLMPLESRLGATVEISGLCVAPGHRQGTVIGLLATGIARYLHLTGYRYVLGAVPVDVSDGGNTAAAVWDLALRSALAPAARRCRPRHPIPIGRLHRAGSAEAPPARTPTVVPPLLRAALRAGAQLCGPPGADRADGRAVFLLMLDIDAIDPSRRQWLLRGHG